MKKGDLVRLSIQGAITLGMMNDPVGYGTGVFLGWTRGSEYIATIYWLGGAGYKEVPKKYFQQKT